jgi:methionyl-tRNA formyltransferase
MIPSELRSSIIDLPPADRCPIVAFTGGELRHDRFALRLQSEFPGLVVAWIRIVPSAGLNATGSRNGSEHASRAAGGVATAQKISDRVLRVVSRGIAHLQSHNGRAHIAARIRATLPRARRWVVRGVGPQPSQVATEERIFGDEVRRMRKIAYVEPTMVANPNDPEVIAKVRALDPYFILTLGGAIYGRELRECARGLALNQHDGWCPDYRGTDTVGWALYHRDLARIGNTIHILADGMDSGPILRRSTVCLAADDTLESCFARSVALGTELMVETVRELIATKRARIFPQPQLTGHTYLGWQMNDGIVDRIRGDLRQGLIASELSARIVF